LILTRPNAWATALAPAQGGSDGSNGNELPSEGWTRTWQALCILVALLIVAGFLPPRHRRWAIRLAWLCPVLFWVGFWLAR
jgi:hypothetical protein